MCGGATSAQNQLQGEEADFYKNQISAYNNAYSQFQSITNTLNQQFQPIMTAGPGQMGYTPAELADLNTLATQGTAASYNQATTAMNEQEAAMGGGTTPVNATGGPAAQARMGLASTAAGQEATQRLQIQQAGYAQGLTNYQGAITGEEALASGWNPNAFAGSATSAGGAASAEANTIASQQQGAWGTVLGALGGVAGAAMGNPGLANMFKTNPSSSTAPGPAPFTGAFAPGAMGPNYNLGGTFPTG